MAAAPIRRRRSRARILVWGALGLWAVALAVFFVVRVPTPARAGQRLATPETTVRRMDGSLFRLIASDSPTVVLAATSECAACRQGVPTYREISDRLRSEGVAFRVLVGSDSLAARQFTFLLSDRSQVGWDPGQKMFRQLGVRSVPSMYLMSRDGRLMKSWVPFSLYQGAADTILSAVRQSQ
jgi:hypothetical protein